MPNPRTELTAVLLERSRRLRRRAETTRANSSPLHELARLLRAAARDTLIESSTWSRRRLAGGSDHRDEASPSFARSVAQELTPALATLRFRLDVMLDEIRGDEPLADFIGDLETLRRRVEQMTVVVRALTALDSEPSFDLHPVDLNGIVEDVLLSVTPRLAGRVVIRRNLDRNIPAVLADTEALRYALTSFVETVAECSPTLDITTRREVSGHVRVDVGVSPKRMPVRELMLQADPLRLVLAQSIVRSLGGTLEQRIANSGRAFSLTLRAADAR
jgi:C4-dicarboxylate-specific signal transduction histidine kinase